MWFIGNSLWVQNVSFTIYLEPHSCCSRHSAVNWAILQHPCCALKIVLSHHTLLSPPSNCKASGLLAYQGPRSRCPAPLWANWCELNWDNRIPL